MVKGPQGAPLFFPAGIGYLHTRQFHYIEVAKPYCMKTSFLFLAFFSLFVHIACAQNNFTVPANYTLKEKDDYKRYEKDVVAAAEWLVATDLDKEQEKRKDINAFVLKWVSGSPNVNIELDEPVSRLYGKNFQLLAIYLASYAAHVILSDGTSDRFSETRAGIESMIKVYKKGIAMERSREMEKAIRQQAEGKLDKYIRDKFKL